MFSLGVPSTVAKILIGDSVNGNIVWVDSKGYTLETAPCRKMRRELMESKNGIESALANLIQLSSGKGFGI